ncbi:hypothetical protein CK203_102253 [Vitis vinifera]|uniref:Uncharacterized protein n=1 Tax=Vitis vinifera TaxID=29760 RepID=A0A438D361_VITVI|nr:hypothetical protein CK203_102253 [Vitis vinifera]
MFCYRDIVFSIIGATPYSSVYGMEVMLLVEIEMGSLRVTLEQQISEADPRINGLGVGHMSLKIDSRGCKMVDGSKWKPSLRADQCRSIKEVLCLRLWSQDG